MKSIVVVIIISIFSNIGFAAEASTRSDAPKQSTSPVEIRRSKVLPAIELIRKGVCPECPAYKTNKAFYSPMGSDEDLTEMQLNIKKPMTVAGIEFDVPITIYLNNTLPDRIMTSDNRNPLPARKSPIGLISAQEIPITPDGKIAKLKYPKRLGEMFKDKTSYSIAQFFWDSEDNQIGPTDFRTEKRVTVCGVTLEKGETIHYEWSDGYWGGPFKNHLSSKDELWTLTSIYFRFSTRTAAASASTI